MLSRADSSTSRSAQICAPLACFRFPIKAVPKPMHFRGRIAPLHVLLIFVRPSLFFPFLIGVVFKSCVISGSLEGMVAVFKHLVPAGLWQSSGRGPAELRQSFGGAAADSRLARYSEI